MNFVLDIIFLLVIFLALVREKTIIGKPSSPLNLMIVFNMGVLGLYYITAKPLGFHPLTFRTFEVLLYGLFVFAIVSLVYTSGVIKPRCCFNDIKLRYVKDYPSKGLLIFAALTILFMLYKLSNFGVENVLEDEDTAASFGGNGLNGHILVIQILLATHLMGRKQTWQSIAALAGLFFCLFMYNVKAWVIIPFLIGLFLRRDIMGMKINFFKMALLPLAIFVLFSTSYMLTMEMSEENMLFIWGHFFKYVYAGIGGLNEALLGNYPIGAAPWYGTPSFVRLFFPVDIKTSSVYDYVVINDLNGEYTNVFSLIGGAYLFNGGFWGAIYLMIIAIISYLLYQKRLKTINYWYYLSYYLWSSGLILSFFGNYYTLLNVWELTAEAFFIGMWFKYKTNCKHSSQLKCA